MTFDTQPRREEAPRWMRALLGALLGALPGVLFIVGVAIVVEVFNLSGDTAQISFIGIPIAFVGLIAGAVIGYNRRPGTVQPAAAPAPFTAIAIGALVGVAISVVLGFAGLGGSVIVMPLLVILGGLVGGMIGRSRQKSSRKPRARAR